MASDTNNWKIGEVVSLPRAEKLLKKGFSASYETFIASRYICIREATDKQQGVLVKVLGKAAFDTVFRLARALHVPPQSIVEPLL